MNTLVPGTPLLIHTDLGRIERSTIKKIDRESGLLKGLQHFLENSFPDQELWFPAFNYDFARTRLFDPENDPVQVGALNESIRSSEKYKRSKIPFFSIIRPENAIFHELGPIINPFNQVGEFAELQKRNGYIALFGASINALTYVHYIEDIIDIPYRYAKTFNGKVLINNKPEQVSVTYLVRPPGMSLDYDWIKIHNLLNREGLPIKLDKFGGYEIYNAHALMEFMLERYHEDLFWPLTTEWQDIVRTRLDQLGRSFKLEDFESGYRNA